jgi:spermidine/putrescine transport system ATP-binding protein
MGGHGAGVGQVSTVLGARPEVSTSPPVFPAASLVGVRKRYDGHDVVADLRLEVRSGEFLSLLGPSGCGKTTTLRIIAGLENPDAGTVCVGGRDVTRVPAYRRDVNTVFQDYALFPHMTVAENVAYGLRRARVPRSEVAERVRDALGMVKMQAAAGKRPATLSGGQRQRVALARALVNRPSVLLLDEPLSALDRQLREHMQVELSQIQRAVGITFIYVTHDQEEAMSLSDRIAVMNGGRIEQLGGPGDVYDRPATRFVAEFVGQQNTFEGELDAEAGVLRSAHGVLRAERVVGASSPEAVATVRPEHVTVVAARKGDDWAGEVVGRARLGELWQTVVRLDTGHEVISRSTVASGAALALGERVTCRWSPADVHAFGAMAPGPNTN